MGAILLAWIAALSGGCQKRIAEDATSQPEPEPPAATPVAVATPKPSTPVAIATPTPVPDPMAPPGIFYLISKHSITTSEGIVGLRPGQVLQEVSPGTYKVGEHTVQLPSHLVTNNLRVAGQYASADAAAMSAIRQSISQQNAAANAAAAAPATTPAARTTAVRVVPTASNTTSQPAPSRISNSSLGGGNSLGGTHTKTQGGWLYQRNESGVWVPIRPLGN